MQPTPQDLQQLHRQLGRPPRGLLQIQSRCPSGHPQTISVYPLLHQPNGPEPFPTIFWLSCPSLIEQLARLEHSRLITVLEARFATDPSLRASLFANHRAYIAERWNLLSVSDRRWLRNHGWHHAYLQRGIGGITHWHHLKCLHLHYAHHQARHNVVGHYLTKHHHIHPCH